MICINQTTPFCKSKKGNMSFSSTIARRSHSCSMVFPTSQTNQFAFETVRCRAHGRNGPTPWPAKLPTRTHPSSPGFAAGCYAKPLEFPMEPFSIMDSKTIRKQDGLYMVILYHVMPLMILNQLHGNIKIM